ncbi:MAG: GNAT family N-acetyltransferase [Solirubrobacteraceae bacterium]
MTAAALRTPPFGLLTSELAQADVPDFVRTWLEHDPECPGVNSIPATARAIAAAFGAQTGGAASLTRSMAMHAVAEVVDPPHRPPGRLRLGTQAERDLLIDWWVAFAAEALAAGDADHAARMVDARLGEGRAFVWDDDGPVSVVALSPAVAGVPRIGPVYTPPAYRRRGYAAMAVAEVSRRALAAGAKRCMLFTDLANPTSNKIYAEVGYHRFGAWAEYRLDPPRNIAWTRRRISLGPPAKLKRFSGRG